MSVSAATYDKLARFNKLKFEGLMTIPKVIEALANEGLRQEEARRKYEAEKGKR